MKIRNLDRSKIKRPLERLLIDSNAWIIKIYKSKNVCFRINLYPPLVANGRSADSHNILSRILLCISNHFPLFIPSLIGGFGQCIWTRWGFWTCNLLAEPPSYSAPFLKIFIFHDRKQNRKIQREKDRQTELLLITQNLTHTKHLSFFKCKLCWTGF